MMFLHQKRSFFQQEEFFFPDLIDSLAKAIPTAPEPIITTSKSCFIFIIMVPRAGLEPARSFLRGILSPLCLPISPPGQCSKFYHQKAM